MAGLVPAMTLWGRQGRRLCGSVRRLGPLVYLRPRARDTVGIISKRVIADTVIDNY
jgi:hypothetical protein